MNSMEKQCCNCHCHDKVQQVPVTLRDTFFQDPIFSRSWDEFDQMRRDMIAESRQAWTKFDEEMKKLETKSFAKSLNIETSIGESKNPTPAPPPPPPAPKEEIKEEKKDISSVEQHPENKLE